MPPSVKRGMSLRSRIIILVAVLAATAVAVAGRVVAHAQPAVPAASNCGVQRWAGKTMTDAAARSVNLAPRLSTIAALGRLSAPARLGLRFGRTERTNFRLHVRPNDDRRVPGLRLFGPLVRRDADATCPSSIRTRLRRSFSF